MNTEKMIECTGMRYAERATVVGFDYISLDDWLSFQNKTKFFNYKFDMDKSEYLAGFHLFLVSPENLPMLNMPDAEVILVKIPKDMIDSSLIEDVEIFEETEET